MMKYLSLIHIYSSIRIGGAGSYSRSFWETAPSGAVPENFLRAGFRCQAAAILTHVAEHDDAGRVTKAHGGAENVVIGVDDAKRLWVFRVIPGDEGVSWFYQSTPVEMCIRDREYPVQNIDDLVVGLEPAEAYESLVRIKENPSPQFWYSLNGRSLEGEIAKTKNAAEADSEDDSDTEIVHGLFTSRWDDGSVIVTGCKAVSYTHLAKRSVL